ncbi:hypothetical protein QBC35DRAFT_550905 [Podospora australis]|uniref:DUF6546 domain-containing protein n=1 Tax=Podospora australis TaxID=1536484 RepID=A0AAN6WUK4_9PEZI|nr:hypothetical protein QBC35DRAFT_550905 [Podospora australis]
MYQPRRWDGLPWEIRHPILEALIKDGCKLARFATVSREWQMEIERHTFARIKLTPSRLADFRSMVHRNWAVVRYIWFCLELDGYDCTKCAPRHIDPECFEKVMVVDTDTCPITASFQNLFSILSTWEPSGHLILDISIYSPSDSEHWFKYLTFLPDHASALQTIPTKAYDGYEHGWMCGSRDAPPPEDAIRKIFFGVTGGPFDSNDEEFAWWDQLPSVPAKPVVFENFNQQYPTSIQDFLGGEDIAQCDSTRIPRRAVSCMIALASLPLEHLAASFLVDSRHFFAAIEPSWERPNLTSLVLTSKVLRPKKDPGQIGAMLHAAAAAAMRMPRLETMEIWNGRKDLAAVFQYQTLPQRNARRATVTWRATWEFTMEPSLIPVTIRAWEAVVHRRYDDNWSLGVVNEWLDLAAIKSHGDAIPSLKLSGQVIRPVSLQQIQREQKALEGVKTVK